MTSTQDQVIKRAQQLSPVTDYLKHLTTLSLGLTVVLSGLIRFASSYFQIVLILSLVFSLISLITSTISYNTMLEFLTASDQLTVDELSRSATLSGRLHRWATRTFIASILLLVVFAILSATVSAPSPETLPTP